MLISFSGIDGAGKSTQISLVANLLSNNKISATYLWARGGYTPGFETLKRFVRYVFPTHLPPPGISNKRTSTFSSSFISWCWISIAIIDLFFFWVLYIRYLKFRGQFILCDRFLDDTLLDFQYNFPNFDIQNFVLWRALRYFVPKPDLAFLFLISVEESLRRSSLKNEPFPDDESTITWRLSQYSDQSRFPQSRYIVIDCMASPVNVFRQIEKILATSPEFNRF